jgi:N-acetyl-beta-hexosaminidase
MSSLGVEAKLCTLNDKDASVHVLIDTSICKTPSSYEIQIGDGQVNVIGGDRAGVVYGMYTLFQHLKTHSERSTDGSAACLTVPATVISDRPAVTQRAVLWSYRHLVRTPAARAQEQIEMLARLRMNALFVAIDEPSPTVSDGEALTALLHSAAHSLVDVVPTVVVCSIHQG